jgi:hypothetical protein
VATRRKLTSATRMTLLNLNGLGEAWVMSSKG